MLQQKNGKLRIAVLGTRGIPAAYGGFETFAEQLSRRLVNRGHDVCVYGRRRFGESTPDEVFQGVRTTRTPTLHHKYLETPLHALTSFLSIRARDFDVVLLCNAANSPFAGILKLKAIPLAINVDGIERRRTKWNLLGRLWYRLGERCSVLFGDRVVSDAEVIADYYTERFGLESTVIPYGANPVLRLAGPTLAEFGLESKQFILYVSRLEPENNALGTIEAYVRSGVTLPLVVVGDAPYADEYKEQLRRAANDRVIFTGFRFGEAYEELRSHCQFAIQATEVGGTHPALVESMAYGNCIIANDVPEHREVLGQTGVYYRFNDFNHLADLIRTIHDDAEQRATLGSQASARARIVYSWEAVTDAYEQLFYEMLGDEVPQGQAIPISDIIGADGVVENI